MDDPNNARRRIAVVVVHGVGDQNPGDTQRDVVASLLARGYRHLGEARIEARVGGEILPTVRARAQVPHPAGPGPTGRAAGRIAGHFLARSHFYDDRACDLPDNSNAGAEGGEPRDATSRPDRRAELPADGGTLFTEQQLERYDRGQAEPPLVTRRTTLTLPPGAIGPGPPAITPPLSAPPASAPTSSAPPASAPTSSAQPASAPTSSAQPASAPTSSAQPASAPIASAPETVVDVVEFNWADLSRLSQGTVRIVLAFFYLLFQLTALGRLAVDSAEREFASEVSRRKSAWGILGRSQSVVATLLARWIPLANLGLAAAVLLALALFAPGTGADTRAWYAAALVGLATAGIASWALVYRRARPHSISGFLLAPIGIGIAALFTVRVGIADSGHAPVVLLVLWLVLTVIAVGMIGSALEPSFPGIRTAAVIVALVLLAAGLASVVAGAGNPEDEEIVYWTVLRVAELFFLAASALWMVLIAAQAINTVAAVGIVRGLARGHPIRRALWTGQLGFLIPTALFIFVAVFGWTAIYAAATSIESLDLALRVAGYDPVCPHCFRAAFAVLEECSPWSESALCMAATLSFQATSIGILLLEGFGVAAIAVLLWGIVPSVWLEADPPEPERAARPRDSARLGHWLDAAFRSLFFAGIALLVAIFAGALLAVSELLPSAGLHEYANPIARASLWVVGSGVGLMGLAALVGDLAGRLRAPLDVALDIENWLREDPPARTPQARVIVRLRTLIAHLLDPRTPGGGRYGALVFVAHSQGSVIVADTLRHLKSRRDDPLARAIVAGETRLSLLTLGTPLAQLYALRFPTQYGWVRRSVGITAADGSIAATQSPDPIELDLERWMNIYCSGDYVGRELWRHHDHPGRFVPPSGSGELPEREHVSRDDPDARKARRLEFCLGSGAHTHYFDPSAPLVAEALDWMIRRA